MMSSLKKVAKDCQKECRRAANLSMRITREAQTRSRRLSKEMMAYWKRFEKVEKEHRRRAEKEAQEQRKMELELMEVRKYYCVICFEDLMGALIYPDIEERTFSELS